MSLVKNQHASQVVISRQEMLSTKAREIYYIDIQTRVYDHEAYIYHSHREA
jgi:hypothetical protein